MTPIRNLSRNNPAHVVGMIRFANIFKRNIVSIENILSAVKAVKFETSLDLSCKSNTLTSELSQVNIVEEKLKTRIAHSSEYPDRRIAARGWMDNLLRPADSGDQGSSFESSEQINEALTNEDLRTAAEMFVYLTMCPNEIKPWLIFYKDLFQTQSPDQIILTLNRVIKQAKKNKYFKTLAEILLKRILMMLSEREAENTTSNAVAIPLQKFEGNYFQCLSLTYSQQLNTKALVCFFYICRRVSLSLSLPSIGQKNSSICRFSYQQSSSSHCD